ncbi:MAG: exodeoxyribonuclease VII large subunit [Streptococcaceae bacterium]|nr:exodeoxyribonuclease VII large subunit [Streptococcaceae bacterium]
MTKYLTVSALTKYLKAKFDKDPYLEKVYLTGEISNFRQRPSHQYFAIKDENAVVQAIMWAGQFNKLDFKLEDGMKVLVTGRVSIYPANGSYSINIENIVPDGVGALAVKFEQLKKRLTEEGLFNEQHKQVLPQIARRIAVVTSPSGAVIKDIITTVNRRFPLAEIVLYPTKVQGEGAAEEIATNIERANAQGDFDLLIIGRGGGSIEDLWCFNEEIVVRAIFESHLPVISSVGHETDITLSDFVADRRAATPTAAAELASSNTKIDLLNWLREQETRLSNRMIQIVKHRRERVDKLANSVMFRQPERLYDGYIQKVEQLTDRMQHIMEQELTVVSHRHQYATNNLIQSFTALVENRKNRADQMYQSLLLLDISKIKNRGFALVKSGNKIVKSINDVKTGQNIEIELSDGSVNAEIKGE